MLPYDPHFMIRTLHSDYGKVIPQAGTVFSEIRRPELPAFSQENACPSSAASFSSIA
jgi:hypothetical protein